MRLTLCVLALALTLHNATAIPPAAMVECTALGCHNHPAGATIYYPSANWNDGKFEVSDELYGIPGTTFTFGGDAEGYKTPGSTVNGATYGAVRVKIRFEFTNTANTVTQYASVDTTGANVYDWQMNADTGVFPIEASWGVPSYLTVSMEQEKTVGNTTEWVSTGATVKEYSVNYYDE